MVHSYSKENKKGTHEGSVSMMMELINTISYLAKGEDIITGYTLALSYDKIDPKTYSDPGIDKIDPDLRRPKDYIIDFMDRCFKVHSNMDRANFDIFMDKFNELLWMLEGSYTSENTPWVEEIRSRAFDGRHDVVNCVMKLLNINYRIYKVQDSALPYKMTKENINVSEWF